MHTNPKAQQTAFPAQAAQDNFGKIFTPFPGFNMYDYVLLQFALTGAASDINFPDQASDEQAAAAIMEGAKCLADAYFDAIQPKDESKVINL